MTKIRAKDDKDRVCSDSCDFDSAIRLDNNQKTQNKETPTGKAFQTSPSRGFFVSMVPCVTPPREPKALKQLTTVPGVRKRKSLCRIVRRDTMRFRLKLKWAYEALRRYQTPLSRCRIGEGTVPQTVQIGPSYKINPGNDVRLSTWSLPQAGSYQTPFLSGEVVRSGLLSLANWAGS